MSLTKDDIAAIRTVFNDGFEELVAPRFDGVEQRLDGVEQRLDGVEQRLDGVEQRLNGVEQRLGHVESNVKELQTDSVAVINRLRPIDDKIDELTAKVDAYQSDVKEIYNMIANLQSGTITDKDFGKKSLEDKLLTLNAELLSAAKQAGIALPRN
jgi:archaellum component FlaC